MSQELIKYLSQLNSTESQWGIYINPEDFDEYTCCQYNGPEGWVKIGTPDSLSFGFQSTCEAIESWIDGNSGVFQFEGRTVRVNKNGLIEAWANGNLADDFQEFIEEQAEAIKEEWAVNAAENFVEQELPFYLEAAEELALQMAG